MKLRYVRRSQTRESVCRLPIGLALKPNGKPVATVGLLVTLIIVQCLKRSICSQSTKRLQMLETEPRGAASCRRRGLATFPVIRNTALAPTGPPSLE